MKMAFCLTIMFTLLAGGMGCFAPSTSSVTAAEVENGIFELVNAERTENELSALTRNSALDEIAREYAASQFAEETRYSSDLVYMVNNTWQQEFIGSAPLNEDTADNQVNFCMSEPDMRSALLREEATKTGVGVVTVGSTIYMVQVFDVVRTSGGDGGPIILIENPDATDPTWAELKAFLETDTTDDIPYVLGSFICGDYAEALHNNAEAASIRAAYVLVRLNEEPGHALNAFNVGDTTVFIDVGSADKVAYVEVGKDYGVIELDVAVEFTYTYFETYVTRFEDYFADMDDYSNDLSAYNAEVVEYNNSGASFPEIYDSKTEWYEALQDQQAELSARITDLDTEKTTLGIDDSYFLPTQSLAGVEDHNVVDYYVHW